jgi:adenylate cyclase
MTGDPNNSMPRAERRLAAILAADIAGYSALMGTDEEATVRELKAHQAVVLPIIINHGGHVIDTAGDGILAEFPSTLNAVRSALAIQDAMAQRNASVEPTRCMQFRIGVNQGDVISDGVRVYGDGVNIAARLEALAQPGGICVSGKVYDELQGKLVQHYDDLGSQQLKNISLPVRVYGLRSSSRSEPTLTSVVKQEFSLPDRPSIAVLPFTNMSGDPAQEFFSDGIAEDLVTALSKLRWLFVIARNSSFTYRSKAVDIRRVGRELGVRYVLEGSVQRAADRVRVTGQLVDATNASHVWAERYDRDLADIFAVQDEITQAVAAAIGSAIVDAERQRAVRKPPESLGAWEAYQRGIWHLSKGNAEDHAKAQHFFQKAAEIDPNFAATFAGLAGAILNSAMIYHQISIEQAAKEGEAFARKAVALDQRDARARARVAQAVFAKGDLEGSILESDEALLIDPNCDVAYSQKAISLILLGRHEEGRQAAQAALRLSPRDPARPSRLAHISRSYYLEGNYKMSESTLRQLIREYPGHTPAYEYLIASFGQLGKLAEAKAMIAMAPSGYDQYSRHRPPFRLPVDHEHIVDGLRKAGWPG